MSVVLGSKETLLHRDSITGFTKHVNLCGKSVRSGCDGSSDRSFMVDPLNYFRTNDLMCCVGL